MNNDEGKTDEEEVCSDIISCSIEFTLVHVYVLERLEFYICLDRGLISVLYLYVRVQTRWRMMCSYAV